MKHSLRALLVCPALLGLVGTAAAQASKPHGDAVLDIVIENALADWSVLPIAAESTPTWLRLPAFGKVVLHGDAVHQGLLEASEGGLRLVSNDGAVVALDALAFSFAEGGTGEVHASGAQAFDLTNVTWTHHPDGGLQLIAELVVGELASELGVERGTHVATVVAEVDAPAVRRSQHGRTQLATPQAPTGGGSGSYTAPAAGPDVVVWAVGDSFGSDDIQYYGQSGGLAAYALATQSCNVGSETLDWFANPDPRHPVIGQNMFRYHEGRFEQIGQSWLKHAFCAVNEFETGCGPCNSSPCSNLGIGCADTYTSGLNDGSGGRSKSLVNAATGVNQNGAGPSGTSTIRGRLQVPVADIDPAQNLGAEWFIEAQYVTADDAEANASRNNASWRRVVVNAVSNVNGGGPTEIGQPAIYAWQDQDPAVEIKTGVNTGEAAGTKTWYYVGYRVTQLGPSAWRYEYAVQNLTSDQSARTFELPVPNTVTVTDLSFHDVDYHSGDPYDGTDWTATHAFNTLQWATDTFATNSNANALRWGTLYNFGFTADTAPVRDDLVLGLFKPGLNAAVTVQNVLVPDAGGPPSVGDHSGGLGQFEGPYGGGGVTASSSARNGRSGTNPQVFVETAPAVLGRDWIGRIESGEGAGFVLIGLGGAGAGTWTPLGELLVRPPLLRRFGQGPLHVTIPNEPGLSGRTLALQALVLRDGQLVLSNAIDVVVGDRE